MSDRPLILIAEDYEPMRYAICRILQADYNPVGVDDGTALLEAVRTRPPDVVLLDISMRGMDGIVVARELRERHPEIRVIFVTAHSEPTYVREAFGLGAQGYVLKRALSSTLIAAVEQVLAGGRYLSPGLLEN